jgi:hypothetical protein
MVMSSSQFGGLFDQDPDELRAKVTSQEWYHGTSGSSARGISRDGQRANVRPQTGGNAFGPGLYVTTDFGTASGYAKATRDPAVQRGVPDIKNPISVDYESLTALGHHALAKAEEQGHVVNNKLADPRAMGNIELRRRGYDFMHMTDASKSFGGMVGAVIRPGLWKPKGTQLI